MSVAEVKQYEPVIWRRAPRVSERGFLYDEIGSGFVAVGNAPAPGRGLVFTKQRTLMGALVEIAKVAAPYEAGTAADELQRARAAGGSSVLMAELESLVWALGEGARPQAAR